LRGRSRFRAVWGGNRSRSDRNSPHAWLAAAHARFASLSAKRASFQTTIVWDLAHAPEERLNARATPSSPRRPQA